jgi:hypothetical protein
MIDNTNIADLVQEEIRLAVDRYVQAVLADQQWQHTIEQRITEWTRDRILARFQNVGSIPDLVEIIRCQVKDLFDTGHVPGLSNYVDQQQINRTIDSSVQKLITESLDHLIADDDWVNKIQQHVDLNMGVRITQRLSDIDINAVIAQEVNHNFERWRREFSEEFRSAGIHDEATAVELVVSDGAVVARSGLACDNLLVQKSLKVNDLVLTGSVNTDCESWNELASVVANRTQDLLGEAWQQQLVQQVLQLARDSGIDFNEITVRGSPLVQGDRLNASIITSSLQKVGLLQDLTVSGATRLAQTMDIRDRRVGINTDNPDMALSVWDEEVSISLGKTSRDRAWIGSNRQQTLDIGVNRRRSITIEPDGLVVMDRLRLDRWRISFANAVPNHSGTRGDIVFNHDPKPGTPLAWQCLGGFQWQAVTVS